MIEYNHKGMTVASLHDERTGSFQYVVVDEATKTAAIIDPVLDFDPRAGATATDNADMILEYVRAKGLTVEWVLDTHPHADHFSAAPYLAEKTGGKTAIGTKVVEVQKLWQDIYCLPDLPVDGSQWDRLFADGEQFRIGSLDARRCAARNAPSSSFSMRSTAAGEHRANHRPPSEAKDFCGAK